jgi:hypothetical protein
MESIEMPIFSQTQSCEAPTTQSTPAPSPEGIEKAIDSEANRIISATLQKHNMTLDQLNQQCPGAVEDARNTAKQMIERDTARKENPMYAELEQEREKSRLLQAQVNALKTSRTNTANDRRPAITAEQARAQVGELEWNHRMTDAQRLQVLGVEPSTVDAATRQQIMAVFGPKSDHRRASDLMKADAFRYRQLKEIGRALRLI